MLDGICCHKGNLNLLWCLRCFTFHIGPSLFGVFFPLERETRIHRIGETTPWLQIKRAAEWILLKCFSFTDLSPPSSWPPLRPLLNILIPLAGITFLPGFQLFPTGLSILFLPCRGIRWERGPSPLPALPDFLQAFVKRLHAASLRIVTFFMSYVPTNTRREIREPPGRLRTVAGLWRRFLIHLTFILHLRAFPHIF